MPMPPMPTMCTVRGIFIYCDGLDYGLRRKNDQLTQTALTGYNDTDAQTTQGAEVQLRETES